MEKAKSALLAVIIVLSVFSSLNLFSTIVKADILHVGPGQTYTTIADAITAASDGDSIFIHDGIYYEDGLEINPGNLTIEGESRSGTIIQSNISGTIMTFVASMMDPVVLYNVELRNLTITTTDEYGEIAIYTSTNFSVNNCTFNNGTYLSILNSDNFTVDNCIFENGEPLIAGLGLSMITINFGKQRGEEILTRSDGLVKDCTFRDANISGISIIDSAYNTIRNNTFENLYPQDATNQSEYAIEIFDDSNTSSDNYIYYNNFIDIENGNNSRDNSGGVNTFDDGVGLGNYWSDYVDVDVGDDGIWDNPYVVNGTAGSQDNYPSVNSLNVEESEPLLSSENPSDGATGVDVTTATVNVTITQTDGDLFNWKIGGQNITTISDTDDTTGEKTANIIGPLNYHTTYVWWVNASDDDGYINESYTFTTGIFETDAVYVDDDYNSLTPGWKATRFDTISEAIICINESGTIYIYDGFYEENLTIEKSLNLTGVAGTYYENHDDIILNCSETMDGIWVKTNHVNISGFTILNPKIGIVLNPSANNCSIKGMRIYNSSEQCVFFLSASDNIVIKNNFTVYDPRSFYAVDSNDASAKRNILYHNNFLGTCSMRHYILSNNVYNSSYPIGGNYWSGYDTAEDIYQGVEQNVPGSDGIADEGYLFGGSGYDYYPLMSPYRFENQRPYVYNPLPVDVAVDVAVDYENLRITILDEEGDVLEWTMECAYITNVHLTGATSGTKTVPITSTMPYFTYIVWYVNVSDGYGWTNTTHMFRTVTRFVGSIQDAIDAADPGETIYVYNGIFEEKIEIDKPLVLIGQSKENTVIQGNGTGNVVTITSDNVNISGFTIRNHVPAAIGIRIINRTNVTIYGNNIYKTATGISASSCKNTNIIDNKINSSSSNGISMSYGLENKIRKNTISNSIFERNENGIRFHKCINSIVESNIISTSAVGIYSDFKGNGNIYENNIIINHSQRGLQCDDEDNSKIIGNTITGNGGGILLFSTPPLTCDGNIIYRNFIGSNDGLGIWLHYSSYNTIFRNNISGNGGRGLDIYFGSSKNVVCENNFYGYDFINDIPNAQGIGILVRPGPDEKCFDNYIYHNNFFSNVIQITDNENPTTVVYPDTLCPIRPFGANEWGTSEGDGYRLQTIDKILSQDNYVATDGTYVYTSGEKGIKAYRLIGQNLVEISSVRDSNKLFGKIVCDATYVYVICSQKIRIYEFTGSIFKLIEESEVISGLNDIYVDGNDIFVTKARNGIAVYNFSNSTLSFVMSRNDLLGENSFKKIWSDGTYIYAASRGTNGWQWEFLETISGLDIYPDFRWVRDYLNKDAWGEDVMFRYGPSWGKAAISWIPEQYINPELELKFQSSVLGQDMDLEIRVFNGEGAAVKLTGPHDSFSYPSQDHGTIILSSTETATWHFILGVIGKYIIEISKSGVDTMTYEINLPGISCGFFDFDCKSSHPQLNQYFFNIGAKAGTEEEYGGSWSFDAYGFVKQRYPDLWAYSFNGTDLELMGGTDVAHYGCSEGISDGTYSYVINENTITAYSFDGTDFTLQGSITSKSTYFKHFWVDSLSNNIYVTGCTTDTYVPHLSVYSFDGSNFRMTDEIYLIGFDGITGDDDYLYLAEGMGMSVLARYDDYTNNRLIDEQILDYGESYVYSTTQGDEDLFEFQNYSFQSTSFDSVEYVSIAICVKMEAHVGASGSIDLIISDGSSRQTENVALTLSGIWINYTVQFATSPSGGTWTLNEINNLKIGYALGAGTYVDVNPMLTNIKATVYFGRSTYNAFYEPYPSGGNYYDDFDEPSEGAYDNFRGPNQDIRGADGIVDGNSPNPYTILGAALNEDFYPHIYPFTFSIPGLSPQGGTPPIEPSGPVEIPPLQPPKYPNNPFTVPEMYELLRADVSSDSVVTIVVIDSGNTQRTYDGVDLSKIEMLSHPSFGSGTDSYGHGTFVNYEVRYGIQNYVPNAVQYSLKAFDANGKTTPEIFLQAMEIAESMNPDIITISAGAQGTINDEFSQKVKELRAKGILVTVSAGNDGPKASTITSPALSPDAVAVGATDPMQIGGVKTVLDLADDIICTFSSRGPVLGAFPKPDIACPGESIIGPWLSGEKIGSGTSMAAPLAASVAVQTIASNKFPLDIVKIIYGPKIYLDIVESSITDSCFDKGSPDDYGFGIPNTQSAASITFFKAWYAILYFIVTIFLVMFVIYILYKKTKKK